jgi:ATP-dependent DNA helicase RecG
LAAVVALANTEGGILLLGVEDDGTATGLHSRHRDLTGLTSLIASRTSPSLSVRVSAVTCDNLEIAQIQVPKSRQLIATSEGILQRRRLMADGTPEAVPFYPHEFTQRQSSLGLLDPSAMILAELTVDDFNPLERQRIREMIRRYGGDSSLLPLADEELDGALGLTATEGGVRRPTIAGILLLGREEILRRHLPAHEAAFQVLEGTDVRVNEFFRKPLLQTFEEIEQLFFPWVLEREFQVGMFRVPIPNYDRRVFREALVNALVHRDYARLGATHIRLSDDGLVISNPGGFVEGVNLQNILVTEPRPRNPLLADIAKRIGLAERTGRGIDRIFMGMLRYGRPAPDFSRSDNTSVILQLSSGEGDMDFLEIVLREEERTGRAMPLDSLIVLSRLRTERRLAITDLVPSLQKTEHEARKTIEKLAEAGLVEAHGSGRGRTYTLSAKIYRKQGQKADYVRQAGFDHIQQEQMVLTYIDKHGSIKRAEVMELCRITKDQAYKILNRLKKNGKIRLKGERKSAFYERQR